jgi:hypothetical protein
MSTVAWQPKRPAPKSETISMNSGIPNTIPDLRRNIVRAMSIGTVEIFYCPT